VRRLAGLPTRRLIRFSPRLAFVSARAQEILPVRFHFLAGGSAAAVLLVFLPSLLFTVSYHRLSLLLCFKVSVLEFVYVGEARCYS
jgi:hypothetical protein